MRAPNELAAHSIVESALRDHALIATEMASQIVAQVDAYRRVADPDEVMLETERSCDAHIQNFLRSIERTGDSVEFDLTAVSVAQRVREAIPLGGRAARLPCRPSRALELPSRTERATPTAVTSRSPCSSTR